MLYALLVLLVLLLNKNIMLPGTAPPRKHVLAPGKTKVSVQGLTLRWRFLYMPCSYNFIKYTGMGPVFMHPNITISYVIITFCSKLNVFKSK